MSAMASWITCAPIVYPTVCSGADQRKHQSSASLAFVRGIHRWPANSPHKGLVRGKCFHLMTSSWYVLCERELCHFIAMMAFYMHFYEDRKGVYTTHMLVVHTFLSQRRVQKMKKYLYCWRAELHRASNIISFAPSHYLSQNWVIVNWKHRNTLQWNINLSRNMCI